MAGAIAGTAILHTLQTSKNLDTVTLTINNSCNLACEHCYLQHEGPAAIISRDTIDRLFESSFRHLAVVGKEPFYNRESVTVCMDLIERCQASGRTISLITNGLGLSQLPDEYIPAISYLDISMDGGMETYQLYRKGNIHKLIANIEHFKAKGGKEVNGLNVLTSRTVPFLNDMLQFQQVVNFKRLMFSGFIQFSDDSGICDQLLGLEDLLGMLSRHANFLNCEEAFLLLDIFNHPAYLSETDIRAQISRFDLLDKVLYIPADPLLHGIVRLSHEGLLLTPGESLYTREYGLSGNTIAETSAEAFFRQQVVAYHSATESIPA